MPLHPFYLWALFSIHVVEKVIPVCIPFRIARNCEGSCKGGVGYENNTFQLVCDCILLPKNTFESRCEKTGLRGFRPGPTQIRLSNHRR